MVVMAAMVMITAMVMMAAMEELMVEMGMPT